MRSFFDKHKLLTDIAVTVLLCAVMLIAMEIRQPFFFLQDDNCDSYICQYVHSLRSVSNGEFPLYNFHQLGGSAFLEKGQTGQLNLFVYLGCFLSCLFLGHIGGIVDFTVALYFAAGAVGMLLLLQKRFKVRSYVSIIGAICWSFNSFSVYCSSNWIVTAILTGTLPWIILGTQYLIEHGGAKGVILAALPKVFLFYGGHPQYFIYAVIFDYLFAVTYIAVFAERKAIIRQECRFTIRYFVSGLLLTLWSLPLLGPMFEAMRHSVDRSGALIWDDFIKNKFRIVFFLQGLINPFLTCDFTDCEIIDGKKEYYIIALDAIQKNMSHIGYILLVAAVWGFVHLISRIINKAKRDDRDRLLIRQMYSLIPAGVIALLWAGTDWFNMIVYRIPVLNQFRYPLKLMQIVLFFLIVFSTLSLEMFTGQIKSICIKKIAPVLLVAVQCINLLIVYFVLPVRYFGVYMNSPVPYEESLSDMLSGSRYVTVLDHPMYWDLYNLNEYGAPVRTAQDTVSFLSNNFATYFGLDCICGYDLMMTSEMATANDNLLMNYDDVGGNIYDIYPDMVPQMRSRSVNYYITQARFADYAESNLEQYGIVKVYQDDNRAVFYDDMAMPRAYCMSDSSEGYQKLDIDEHVNYLRVITPADFEGGSVTVSFTHDRRFIGTVDGETVTIIDSGKYDDMTISGVAPGSHEVIYRFVDNTFRNCLIISSAVTFFLAAGILIGRKLKNKEK